MYDKSEITHTRTLLYYDLLVTNCCIELTEITFTGIGIFAITWEFVPVTIAVEHR